MKIIKATLLTILYCTIYYFFQFITGIVIYKTTDFHINGIGTVLCITVILSAILSFIAYQGIFFLRKMKIIKISLAFVVVGLITFLVVNSLVPEKKPASPPPPKNQFTGVFFICG